MERIVIAAYRPKPNKKAQLRELVKTHVARLRKEGLVSDRAPIIAEAEDGTLVEVFGWKSKQAIEAAHENPEVLKMWQEFAEVCDYVPVGDVAEASALFSELSAL